MSLPRAITLLGLGLGCPATLLAQVAVRAAGAPGTYQVLAVAVPASFPADRRVAFEVVPAGAARLLGALHGELGPTSGGGRVVVLTVGVPAGARAGREQVARVRFSGEGGSAIDVPVELDVSRVRRASLTVAQGVFATRLGERAAVRYRLTNTGNAPDSLFVRTTVPPGWVSAPVRAHVLPCSRSWITCRGVAIRCGKSRRASPPCSATRRRRPRSSASTSRAP